VESVVSGGKNCDDVVVVLLPVKESLQWLVGYAEKCNTSELKASTIQGPKVDGLIVVVWANYPVCSLTARYSVWHVQVVRQ